MLNNFKKILVLAPHVDDGELGCGGTIAKFLEEKKEVFYATFSFIEKSISRKLPRNINKLDFKRAMNELGILEKNMILCNEFQRKGEKKEKDIGRNFPQWRQAILDEIIKLRENYKPDLVLLPSSFDTHQDHRVISEEGFRAFKKTASILGYELPWNNRAFRTDVFIPLKEKYISKKIKALFCYKSQRKRNYISKNFIKSLAKIRGVQIDSEYAEAFELIRGVIK